jgi:Prophage CP4-57 regulatory protein (AlpA)
MDLTALSPLVIAVPDIARLLGISRAHAYALIARASPSVRLGRRVVVWLKGTHRSRRRRCAAGVVAMSDPRIQAVSSGPHRTWHTDASVMRTDGRGGVGEVPC